MVASRLPGLTLAPLRDRVDRHGLALRQRNREARAAPLASAQDVLQAITLSIVVVEALVMVVLAVMFTAVWLRLREPGTWLLAIGFAVASGWYFLSGRAPNTGADIDTLTERVSAAAVGVAILLRVFGVALYLGWPAGWMRRFVLLCCLPALASIAWLAVGGALSHRSYHVAGLLPYLGVAMLAFERARQEPGNAHGLLGVALLTLPLLPFALAAAGVDTGDLAWGLLTPAHWHLGSDQVTLLDPEQLALDEAASREAFEAVAPLFTSEGFVARWGAPYRWYVAHESLGALRTASLDRVVARFKIAA